MYTSGPDQKIESFLSKKIGCEFELIKQVDISKLDCKSARQLSRDYANSSDYVDGIKETMRVGAFISPVIVRRVAKTFVVLDGIHRILASMALAYTSVPAYCVEVDDVEADLIASCINVVLNGQGLSEEERRQHFLTAARRQTADVDRVNFRDKLLRQTMAMLSISTHTARHWIAIESIRLRLARLQLKAPIAAGATSRKGEHTEAWLSAVDRFSDEELVKYWPKIIAAKAQQVLNIGKELQRETSAAAREKRIEQLMATIATSVRDLSKSAPDKDRRDAGQIRAHVGGLLKLAPRFGLLSSKYDDVRASLQALETVLIEELTQPDELTEAFQHGTPAKPGAPAH